MVHWSAHKRTAVRGGASSWAVFLVILGILVATLAVVVWYVATGVERGDLGVGESEGSAYQHSENEEGFRVVESESEAEKPAKVDLQPTVDAWVATVGGNKSVLIYDLERDEMVASYNAEEEYDTASLYKLFVVYEGYRRVQTGEWRLDMVAGDSGRDAGTCLDLAIRESNSPCAEALWQMIGYEELDEIIYNDFEITGSDISHLVSNPSDIMKIMKLFYEHPDIEDEALVATMKDSFLNQPVTEYDWRQGLPSGFGKANVYNKVGWDWNGQSWNVYHDAAIVEFPELDRHFIVVVMTNQVPYQAIRELGREIESALL